MNMPKTWLVVTSRAYAKKDGSAESAVTARYEAPGRAQGAFELT